MREITSANNPEIKLYRKLACSKKNRREHRRFVLEGERLIEDMPEEQRETAAVFVTPDYLERHAGLECEEVYLITGELAEKISSTETPQGIFAICRIPDRPPVLEKGGRYLMLCGLRDPGNLGTILRTADALGIDGVFLSGCCDPYSPKAVRSAMGSLFRVRLGEALLGDIFPEFGKSGIPTFAAVVDRDALSVTEADLSRGGAVLIGNEANGLPKELADRCGERITIKMRGGAESLNAAMAAGIIMWEFTKMRNAECGINGTPHISCKY